MSFTRLGALEFIHAVRDTTERCKIGVTKRSHRTRPKVFEEEVEELNSGSVLGFSDFYPIATCAAAAYCCLLPRGMVTLVTHW
jgi:hypothetical protein